ncbi:glycosyltransferase family 2 protein [Lachnospiraceae bacterium JLR.KK009]|nr:glycosyltransferase family 2 protein [Lachnospiraceae bacterium]
MKKISIIVPCYNEEDCLLDFDAKLSEVVGQMGDYEFEVFYIDDGSKDHTLELMRQICKKRDYASYLSFSRNFGKEAAMYAGFCNANGDYVAVMDADLQDPPELLPDMVKFLESGEYDSVATRRINREGEPPIRSLFARMFYKLINKISDADIVDGARDYRLMKKEMADVIVAMGEQNRFSKGIFGWIGFRTYWYAFENVKRAAGETKWSFWKLLKYSMNGIVSFSQVPLSIASWMGMGCTGISLAAIVFIVIRKLIFGDPVQGWASNMCVMIFIGGVQLFCLGVIGQYIGKTYAETKKRPHYIVSECSEGQIKRVG